MTDIRMAPCVLYIKPAKRHFYRGMWMTAEELSRYTGIPRPTIYARLRRGQPFDQYGKHGREPKSYLFRGQMMTVAEISTLTGLHITSVYDRISGGRVLEGRELQNPDVPRNQPAHARMITYKGKTLNHSAWARELGITKNTFFSRCRMGWTIERIVNEPITVQAHTVRRHNLRIIHHIHTHLREHRA